MKSAKLYDKSFDCFIESKKINLAVKRLAKEIKTDLQEEIPLFIGILNGSFIFTADIMRSYEGNCEISFLKLASYEKTSSTGIVNQLIGLNEDLTNRTVVILEDIIDTGTTLQTVYDLLKKEPVKQLKVATLFFKPEVFRKELHIDYVGFSIPDHFIVGYGLDYDGLGRNLPDIYKLSN
ncbi:hypoxanthine phosphoribosyltransferase [Flavicella sediminum]|uniref:hypoxanthine phosphoribosyltransferase n=1 Tax=Flavicella sediminum TaxID=2585141 RepID=UPI00140E1EC2|nr:hypoxanthine phosphoribosyltransferase [Flavicella sediminum]